MNPSGPASSAAAPAPADALAAYPAPRVAPHALHAFGGVWRLTVRRFFSLRHWGVIAGLLGLLALVALGSSSRGAVGTERYAAWAAGFYACLLVPVLAFVSAAGALRDDFKADAVDYVFTRPVPRWRHVVYRYFAHTACAQLEFLLALGVVAGVGVYRGVPGLGAVVATLLLGQVLAVAAFSAFGFLCAAITARFVIVGLVYGGAIEVGLGNVPTQLGWLSLVRHLRALLAKLLETDAAPARGVVGALSDNLSPPAAIAWLLAGTVGLLAAAAAIFARREFAGGAAREA